VEDCVARLSILTLVSAAALGMAAQAQAADLLPPAPSLEGYGYGEEVVELGTGWYLRGDIGYVDYNRPVDLGFGLPGVGTLDAERLDSTWSVGGGIGYQFTNWFRADATVDYRVGAEFSGTRPNPTYDIGYIRDKADFESTTLLLNGYVDLGSWAGVTPYVGAGIGLAGNRFTNVSRESWLLGLPAGSVELSPHTSYNFAWALMGGVGMNFGSGVVLDVGYRYTNLGDARTRIEGPGPGIKTKTIDSHEVRVGARYVID
jgi:opacity protein-like surface antigen